MYSKSIIRVAVVGSLNQVQGHISVCRPVPITGDKKYSNPVCLAWARLVTNAHLHWTHDNSPHQCKAWHHMWVIIAD